MHWCQIDESYLNFLREYECRIPYMDYGGNHYKPFFHSLFTLENGLEYVAQLNHAQKRHKRMRDMPDFKRIFIPVRRKNGNVIKHLAAVINLNYMFPVPSNCIQNVTAENIEDVRTFKDDVSKSKYINLLAKELKVIDAKNLEKDAKKLYDLKCNYPDYFISKRCFDYKELETLAQRFN